MRLNARFLARYRGLRDHGFSGGGTEEREVWEIEGYAWYWRWGFAV